MSTGLFLCVEGSDGSGKSTQHKLLAERLAAEHVPILSVDFPRYGQPSAELVELYLHNEFGDATKLDSRLASLPYAIDRLAASPEITQALVAGTCVLADRFTSSNMAHQGAKFSAKVQRVSFFKWLARLEYSIMGIPEPDYHFILHIPAKAAQERVLRRAAQNDGHTLDAHELDLDHLNRAEEAYLDLAHTFPSRFGLIECMDGKRARTSREIHEEIWLKVKELIDG